MFIFCILDDLFKVQDGLKRTPSTKHARFLLSRERLVWINLTSAVPCKFYQLKPPTNTMLLGGKQKNITYGTLPETNSSPMNIPIFPRKYHQNGGFSMAMLVSGRVTYGIYMYLSLITLTSWITHQISVRIRAINPRIPKGRVELFIYN